MFEVLPSDEYQRLFAKLTPEYQKMLIRFEERLAENPFIGKQLTYDCFREKKFDDKRAIFFIYPEPRIVLMLTIVDKHSQDSVMKWLRKNLDKIRATIPKRTTGAS